MNLEKLKESARRFEQKEEWRKAIDVYLKAIAEVESGADAHPDLSVYNRLGDLYLKTSDTNAAIRTYERAAELYSEQGFYNNAIALCGKILRLNPQRSSVYLKLATLHARKNVIIEAKRNLLAYMEKMHAAGQLDEAFAAVRAAADQFGTNPELRLMLVDLLKAASRGNEADAELAKLEASTAPGMPAAVAGLPLVDVSGGPPSPLPADAPAAPAAPAPTGPAARSSELVFLDVGMPLDASPEPALPLIQADPLPVISVVDELSPFPTGQTAPPVPMDGRAQLDEALQGMEVQAVADGLELPPVIGAAEAEAAPLEGIEQTIFEVTGAESTPLDGLDRPTDAQLDEVRAAAPLEGLEPTVGDVTMAGDDAAAATVSDEPAHEDAALQLPADAAVIEEFVVETNAAADTAEAAADEQAGFDAIIVADFTESPDALDETVAAADRPDESMAGGTDAHAAVDETIELDAVLSEDDAVSPPAQAETIGTESPDEPSPALAEDLPILMADALAMPDETDEAHAVDAADELSLGAEPVEATPMEAIDELVAPVAEVDDVGIDAGDDAVVELIELAIEAETPAESIETDVTVETEAASPEFVPEAAEAAASAAADELPPVTAAPDLEPAEDVEADAFDMDGVIVAVAPAEDVEAPSDEQTVGVAAEDTAASLEELSAEVSAAPDFESAPSRDRLLTLVEELEAKIFDDPGVPETHHRLADALLELGDVDRAVEELGLALAGYEAQDHLGPAWELADRLTAMRPDNIRFHQKRVEIAFRLEDRHKLIDAYLALGDGLVRAGAVDKALAVYRRVLDHDPANRVAHRALESYAPRPAPPPARPAASSGPVGAEAAPSGESFVDLGSMILEPTKTRDTRMTTAIREPTGDEQRDFEEALAAFKRGIEENLDDSDYEAHYDLGVAFKEMGLLDEAIAEFQKALRAPEGRLRTSEALGQSFFEKGQPAIAEAVLRRAVESLEGGDDAKVGVLYWLGRAAEAQGRDTEAVAAYERTMAVDIRFADAADRVQRLGAGRSA